MGRNDWLIRKEGPEPLLLKKTKAYPHWERANESYSHWISGKDYDEIADVTGVPVKEVKKDVAHIESVIPSKQLIANNNTRNRILIQRTQSQSYQKKLKDALDLNVRDYISAGVNPVGPLKEFREAVGMTEKPGGLNIQLNQNNTVSAGGVSRTEDIIRSVMDRMNKAKSESQVIDVEPEEA
jgi:hypothetical protein